MEADTMPMTVAALNSHLCHVSPQLLHDKVLYTRTLNMRNPNYTSILDLNLPKVEDTSNVPDFQICRALTFHQ